MRTGYLFTAASMLAAAFAHPAAAQEAAAPAAGAPAPSQTGSLSEIVVTAQKRSQNLQDVSLSIDALGATQLQDKRVNDIRDLAASAPNVSIGNILGGASIVVRGIGNTNTFTGADPSVALHVDDAVVSQPAAQLGSMFDLDRVEILRGPQGTLYGRNATGGVINLVTAKPTEAMTGYARVTFGNYNLVGTEAAISGAVLPDKLRARLAVKTENHSGYGRNEFTGNAVDNANRKSARLEIEAMPTERLDILLAGEWSHEDDNDYGPKYLAASYPGTTIPQLMAAGADGYAKTYGRNINSDTDTTNLRNVAGYTGTVKYQISDAWSLKSITSFRQFDMDDLWDFATSPKIDNTVQNLVIHSKSGSEELQLAYRSDRLNVQASGFFFHEDLAGDNRVGMRPSDRIDPAYNLISLRFRGNIETNSYAAFLNGDYKLTDQLTLNFGGRYTHEVRSGSLSTYVAALGKTTPFFTAGGADNFSPKVTLEWRPTSGVMGYATYSQGFKSGVILIGAATPILRPETVTNYEVGFKTAWFDRRLVFNIDGFHEDFQNMQVAKQQAALNSPVISTIFENAAGARIDGAEAEASWNITHDFNLHGSVGYLDARFTNYITANPLDLPNAIARQRAGLPLPFAPKWTTNFGASYSWDLPNGRMTLSADEDSKSRMFGDQFADPITEMHFTIYDASLKWTDDTGHYTASLWAKNIGNAFYWASTNVNATSRQIIGNPGDPRTVGVSLGYKF